MLFSFSSTLVAVCCIVSVQSSAPQQKSITNGPVNDAFAYGDDYTLNCEASNEVSRPIWNEFTTGTLRQISDGDFILPGHPEADRYSIDNPENSTVYNLVIADTVLEDGGTYQCVDIADAGSLSASADIITLNGSPNCTTNIPENGRVREDVYYSIECFIGYRGTVAPRMTWFGPDPDETSNWNQASAVTPTSVWSGINMNMSRYFDFQTFSLLFNFTQEDFNKVNFANNVPTWNYTFSTAPLYVEWTPQRMYVVPQQEWYYVGETLECLADSNPDSEFFWRNLDTQEVTNGNLLTFTEDDLGTWRMQCRATNLINDVEYENDLIINVTVIARTTTPPPTTPTTTTPPPAEAPCDDLTGRWTATSPSLIDMCIEVDSSRNGRVIGLVRNSTDPYYIEVRGRVSPNKFDQIGFAGTWPANIGTMAFNGICNKCYGAEILQMTAISRKALDNPTCEDHGALYKYADYAFSRTGPPCREIFKQHNIQL